MLRKKVDDEAVLEKRGRHGLDHVFRRLIKVLTLPTKNVAKAKEEKKKEGHHYNGYFNVLQKSLYSDEIKQREILINLALLCEEANIGHVLFCIEDIDVLFKSMTAAM